MENKELLLKAIDGYDIYKPQGRYILKALVAIAIDDLAMTTVSRLCELSKVSRQGTYNTLRYLENDRVIERIKNSGTRLSSFRLNRNKLDNIIKYYNQQEQAKNILG